MFDWKVEEMKLYEERKEYGNGKRGYHFECERSTSKEDKIAFIDSLTDGKMSYVIELTNQLEQDKNDKKVVVDQWGWVKTNSLVAWVKRTDKKYGRPIINTSYNYGRFEVGGMNGNIQTFYKDDIVGDGDFIDCVFNKVLHECADKEYSYFLEHDEYSVLKTKFRERGFWSTFGVNISDYSSGELCVSDKEGNDRPITMEELKELIEKCEQVQALIDKITEETNIVY